MGRGEDLDIQLLGESEHGSPNGQLHRVVHPVLELVDEKQTILGTDEGQHDAEEAIQPVAEGTKRNRPRDSVRTHDRGAHPSRRLTTDHGHRGNRGVDDSQGLDDVFLAIRQRDLVPQRSQRRRLLAAIGADKDASHLRFIPESGPEGPGAVRIATKAVQGPH